MSGIFSLVNRIVRNSLYGVKFLCGFLWRGFLRGMEWVLLEGVLVGGGVVFGGMMSRVLMPVLAMAIQYHNV